MSWFVIGGIVLVPILILMAYLFFGFALPQIKIHRTMMRDAKDARKGFDFTVPRENVVSHFGVNVTSSTYDELRFDLLVVDTHETLNRVFEAPYEIDANTLIYGKPDEEGSIATMIFSADNLTVNLVAHEVTHLILVQSSQETSRITSSRAWLRNHPEWVAEAVGDTVEVVCNALMEEDNDGEDGA